MHQIGFLCHGCQGCEEPAVAQSTLLNIRWSDVIGEDPVGLMVEDGRSGKFDDFKGYD